MHGLLKDTLVEAIDRKFAWFFAVAVAIALLVLITTRNSSLQVHISTGSQDTSTGVSTIQGMVGLAISVYTYGLVFLGLLCASGVIPHMFSRGIAEFYLSKPLSRSTILWNRFAGVAVVYGGLIVVAGIIPILVGAMMYATMPGPIFAIIALELLSFLVWLCIAVAGGIWFGSTAKVMLTVVAVWGCAKVLSYREGIKALFPSNIVAGVVDVLYYVFPKNGQFSSIGQNILFDQPVESWVPVWSSLLFAVAMLLLAQWRLSRREF